MGLFDLFGNSNDKKWQDQELANMVEKGWDELEDTKIRNEKDRKLYEQEKWSNYEYDDEQ